MDTTPSDIFDPDVEEPMDNGLRFFRRWVVFLLMLGVVSVLYPLFIWGYTEHGYRDINGDWICATLEIVFIIFGVAIWRLRDKGLSLSTIGTVLMALSLVLLRVNDTLQNDDFRTIIFGVMGAGLISATAALFPTIREREEQR